MLLLPDLRSSTLQGFTKLPHCLKLSLKLLCYDVYKEPHVPGLGTIVA